MRTTSFWPMSCASVGATGRGDGVGVGAGFGVEPGLGAGVWIGPAVGVEAGVPEGSVDGSVGAGALGLELVAADVAGLGLTRAAGVAHAASIEAINARASLRTSNRCRGPADSHRHARIARDYASGSSCCATAV
jgi:hypothetical protein